MNLRSLIQRAGLPLAAIAAATSAYVAVATTPTMGTLSDSSVTLTATGGPYAVSNPSATAELVCGPQTCDDYDLTVNVPQAYRDANPNAVVKITLSWTNASGAEDLDLYVLDQNNAPFANSASSDPEEVVVRPREQFVNAPYTVRIVPFAVTGARATLKIELLQSQSTGGGGGGEPADPCLPTGASNAGSAAIDAAVLRDWSKLNLSSEYGAFVRFNQGNRAQQNAVLQRLGFIVGEDFRNHINSVFVTGPVSAFRALGLERSVARIEHNTPIRSLDATGPWVTRAKVMHEPVLDGPFLDSTGAPLTGKGVILGVIDSGMFGPHPDYAGRVEHNWKLVAPIVPGVPERYVDVGTTADSENPAGGHGTHVSGTVFGSGAASNGVYPAGGVSPFIKGTFPGVAPEATMVHWAHGAGLFILDAAIAYNHMLETDTMAGGTAPNGRKLPRAVNNSYGSTGSPAGDDQEADATPTSAACLIKRIVNEKKITMLFAASNDGTAGGAENRTSPTCQYRLPGVICVASYDDAGTGHPDHPLSGFSSTGKLGLHTSYPDIAAPGDLITSTCVQGLVTNAICTGGDDSAAETEWQPLYGTISGTSMATPHVTGALGLILQANPTLKPAQQELLIQKTAVKVGPYPDGVYEPDPQQIAGGTPDGTHHYGFGAGLLDVRAAIEEMNANPTKYNGVAGQVFATASGYPGDTYTWTIFNNDTGSSDTPAPTTAAGDIRQLTMQNATVGGEAGVMARLTVANATSFGTSTSVGYTMEYNAYGRPFKTTVILRPGVPAPTVAPAEPSDSNTAVAQSVTLAGNVISFFVPYSQMNFIPRHEMLHNIRVLSSDQAGFIDIAPSAQNQPVVADTSGATLKPMYGRSFTTTLVPSIPPPSNETTCELPGLTRIVSPTGVTGNGSPVPTAEDLRRLFVAEPEVAPYLDPDKVVFTMETGATTAADYTTATTTRWYIYFKTAGGGTTEQFIAYDKSATAATATGPTGFIYGNRTTIDTPAASLGNFTTIAKAGLLTGSALFTDTDGKHKIRFVVDKAVLGVAKGDDITSIAASLRQGGNAGLTVDSGTATGNYTIVGNDACAVNNAPVPVLVATPNRGKAPLTVEFCPTGTSDPDDDNITNYDYQFGEGQGGEPKLDASCVTHTYTEPGDYTARLLVIDGRGLVSAAAATAEIVVEFAQEAALEFIVRENVKLNTFITSELVELTGFTGSLPVSVGENMQYSIDNGPFTNSLGSVMAGQKIAVRHVSANEEGKATETFLTIGSVQVPFKSITTTLDHVPAPFGFVTQNNVNPGAVVISNEVTLQEYDDAPVQLGNAGTAYSINGGPWQTGVGKIVCGGQSRTTCTARIRVRHKANTSSLGYTKSYVQVGGVRGHFTTRTKK